MLRVELQQGLPHVKVQLLRPAGGGFRDSEQVQEEHQLQVLARVVPLLRRRALDASKSTP